MHAVSQAGLDKDDAIYLANYRHNGTGSRKGWTLISRGTKKWPVKYGVIRYKDKTYRTAIELSEALGVSTKTANKYVRNGRDKEGNSISRYKEAFLKFDFKNNPKGTELERTDDMPE